MQSLKSRIGDKKREFLDYVRDYGRAAAMDIYGIHDYIALHRLLVEWTEDENFGISPRIGGDDMHSFEILRNKIRNYRERDRMRNAEMVAEYKRVKAENDALRQLVKDRLGFMLRGLIEELDNG